MEKNNALQMISGTLVILVVAIIFIFLNVDHGFLRKKECYQLSAEFNNILGLSVGSKVKIRGVDVGRVTSISLGSGLEKVLVEICISNDIKIPTDTTAVISSENLFSTTKFIDLVLGVEDEAIKSGCHISMTQSPLDFESLIKSFISKSL